MSSEIIPFDYSGHEIRVVERDGEPWFVASDVARVLGYTNPHKAVADHCKSATEARTNDSLGRASKTVIIPERDVYRLIMRSKLPAAELFEEWVVGEVLPQIRKTGSYTAQVPQTYAEALQLAADQARELEAKSAELEQARPKIEFFDSVTDSKQAVEMKHVAKILDMGVGRNKLFRILRERGILMGDNTPYQEYVDRGYFRVVEQKYTRSDGETRINFKTLVYQRGVDFIRRTLERELGGLA